MSKRIQLLAGIAAISIALPAWAQDSAAASAPAADATAPAEGEAAVTAEGAATEAPMAWAARREDLCELPRGLFGGKSTDRV